ncbi:MAG: hypothetical protein QM504_02730 [Pseudomonadota bacterium]
MDKEEYIGCLKYSGELVESGMLDARKSAQALLGFDEAIRFFITKQLPELSKNDFEFPVRIRKGSWEIAIPDTIAQWIMAGGGVAATAYAATAAKKMAEHDFDNFGLKDVFKKSLIATQWVIKIGKHLGDLTIKKFINTKFQDNNQMIGIPNAEGDYLYVPIEYLEYYVSINPKLLSNITEIVEDERVLSIGVYENGELIEEKVTRKHRSIFTHETDEDDDVLFPELLHGDTVVLEGEVTRGNEMSNTVGFRYLGHILTAIPASGSIVRFKGSLFLNCNIHGEISRLDDKGRLGAVKPKIIFTHIEPLESDTHEPSLFDTNT